MAGRGGLPRGPGGRALGGRGAMEAPAELLAALPALATALALLLAWLLLRRGAAPAPAPAPERASPTEAPGAPAPPAPPEPSASEPAPAGPRQPERMTELGEPVAEEPVDKGRQVRTEFVVGSPVGHPRACRLNLPRKGRASGRQERRVPAAGTLHPPLKWSWPPSLPPRSGVPGPPTDVDTALHPPLSPPLPTRAQTYGHVPFFKICIGVSLLSTTHYFGMGCARREVACLLGQLEILIPELMWALCEVGRAGLKGRALTGNMLLSFSNCL